jgi:adenosine deaminase
MWCLYRAWYTFQRFDFYFILVLTKSNFLSWTYLDFLKRCAALNVSYIEFTRVMWPDPVTFEQLQRWADEWYKETGVHVRWNSAFVRTLDFDTNTQWTRGLLDILEVNSYPELVGIDLLANETDTPALETGQNIYLPILAADQQGLIHLHRTMHAGELGDIRNVRDAMIMGVDRVGHGVLR